MFVEKQFKWKNYDWQVGPICGDFHHDKNDVWYGSQSVLINAKGELVLDCVLNPKDCNDGKTRNFDVAFIICRKEMKYGIFEWTAKLPMGKNMWPGLWLSSNQEWPPEIDCMEAWSNAEKNTYHKRLFWINLHPTCHWTENGLHRYEGASNISNCLVKQKEYNKYKVEWTPDYVKVFYNGKMVKCFKDKKMLVHMNREDIYMSPIMTFDLWDKNGEKFDMDKYLNYRTKGNPFLVSDFKFTPIEGLSKERYDQWWFRNSSQKF